MPLATALAMYARGTTKDALVDHVMDVVFKTSTVGDAETGHAWGEWGRWGTQRGPQGGAVGQTVVTAQHTTPHHSPWYADPPMQNTRLPRASQERPKRGVGRGGPVVQMRVVTSKYSTMFHPGA